MILAYNCNIVTYVIHTHIYIYIYNMAVPKRFRQTIRKFLKQKKIISVFKNKPLLINTFKKYLYLTQ